MSTVVTRAQLIIGALLLVAWFAGIWWLGRRGHFPTPPPPEPPDSCILCREPVTGCDCTGGPLLVRDKVVAERGGFLYGWSMRAADLEGDQTIDVIVTWEMVDRLCKVLEMEHVHTGRMVHRVPWMHLMNEMRDESRGMNGPAPLKHIMDRAEAS